MTKNMYNNQIKKEDSYARKRQKIDRVSRKD